MKKYFRVAACLTFITVCFVAGIYAARHMTPRILAQRTAGMLSDVQSPSEERTTVQLERVYSNCRHLIVTPYPNPEGMNRAEIERRFGADKGYTTWFADNGSRAVIHQQVEGWCPEDKRKRHLGLFRDHVAVYEGPAGNQDKMLKVTGIRIDALPEELRGKVKNNQMEFGSEEAMNYALENLDEYE